MSEREDREALQSALGTARDKQRSETDPKRIAMWATLVAFIALCLGYTIT